MGRTPKSTAPAAAASVTAEKLGSGTCSAWGKRVAAAAALCAPSRPGYAIETLTAAGSRGGSAAHGRSGRSASATRLDTRPVPAESGEGSRSSSRPTVRSAGQTEGTGLGEGVERSSRAFLLKERGHPPCRSELAGGGGKRGAPASA